MRLTRHAEARRIQRNLPHKVIAAIYSYGSEHHAQGAISLTLDSAAIALAAEDDRRTRIMLERYRGAYMIEANGRGITVARRMRRFRR